MIKRNILHADYKAIIVSSYPYSDKNLQRSVIRDIENQLRKLDEMYNMNNRDDNMPEKGAFDKLRNLMGRRVK